MVRPSRAAGTAVASHNLSSAVAPHRTTIGDDLGHPSLSLFKCAGFISVLLRLHNRRRWRALTCNSSAASATVTNLRGSQVGRGRLVREPSP